ncbi:MAG TPA: anti-sigma factor antagonist [Firmicutes bacterium]|nr:anti-sigma factor antagonist [Bacillota bacterium]HHT42725.1 anti-sigma factor antagonist [Bacillota bacterium]
MQYSFETVGQALIATLRGELDLHTSPQFKEQLAKHFTTHPQIKYLIMDVRDLQFIDSSGLGVILGRYRALEERGGQLYFVQANPHIKRVLQMSGFLKISEFADSTTAVLKRVEGGHL